MRIRPHRRKCDDCKTAPTIITDLGTVIHQSKEGTYYLCKQYLNKLERETMRRVPEPQPAQAVEEPQPA